MKPERGKYILALCLAFLMVFNSAVGAVSAAVAIDQAGGGFTAEGTAGAASGDGAFQKTTAFFGSIFSSDYHAASGNDPGRGLAEAADAGLLDPLLGTLGEFFSELAEDEELQEVLGLVIDDIMADERITGYDPEALVVRALRDDRLAVILGETIARYLGGDELLSFIGRLTGDIKNLLKDPAFVSFLSDAIISLLNDDGIDELVYEIIGVFLVYADNLLGNIGDGRLEQAINEIADELILPFKKVIIKYSDEIMDDPRVVEALEKIRSRLEGIDQEYIDALMEDEDLKGSIASLKELFTEPLLDLPDMIKDNLLEDDAFDYLIELLRENLSDLDNYEELFALLDLLREDLAGVLEVIGGEAGSVVDHYVNNAGSTGEGEAGCTDIDPKEKKKIEDEAARYLTHWSECAFWVVAQVGEDGDLAEVLDKYIGENSQYLKDISTALGAALDEAKGDLIPTVKTVVEEKTASFDVGAILSPMVDEMMVEFDPLFEEILGDALAGFPLAKLLDVIEGESELVVEALMEIIGALPLDLLLAAYENNGQDHSPPGLPADLLRDIISDLPFDVLADLLTKKDIDDLVKGLFAFTDELPLDTVAPLLRANADELGYDIAHALLNGVADGIEFPEPEDPRIEAVMGALKNEERLRRFYLDLGGSDPEKITAESSEAEIILAVILEIAGDEARIERFMEELSERAKPITEELVDYGRTIGDRLLGGLRSFVRPFLQRLISTLFIFTPEDLIAEEDPAGWISYDRFKDDATVAGLLVSEVLTGDAVPGFVDESMHRFLVEHETVDDIATVDRFSVISHFMAEMATAEPVKEILAGDTARELVALAGEGVGGVLDNTLTDMIKPAGITTAVNSLLAGLLPGERGDVYRVSLKTFSLKPGDIVKKITGPLEEEISGATGLVEDLLMDPLEKIPARVLGDAAVESALDRIVEDIPEEAAGVAARVLEDERLGEFLAESVEEMLDEILDEGLDLAESILGDARIENALEEALVTILADGGMRAAIGDLAGDLASDPGLRKVLKEILDNSRKISIDYSKYNGPSAGNIRDPGPGVSGGTPHAYVGRTDLHEPLPAPFAFKDIKISAPFPVNSVTAYAHFYLLAGNNAVYGFTVELIDWLDPSSAFPVQAPGEYLRDFLSNHFLNEDWVRSKVAQPVTAMLTSTLLSIPAERAKIKEMIKVDLLDIPEETPAKLGRYLRTDPKLKDVIATALDLPVAELAGVLDDNEDIRGLLHDQLYLTIAETAGSLTDFIDSNGELRSILEETAVEINLDPMRTLLAIERDLPQTLLDRVSSFPSGMVTRFLDVEGRAYRLGYMKEDLQTRFVSDLLTDPALIGLESALVNEKVRGADYTLAESIFGVVNKFISSEPLGDFGGEKVFDFLADLYQKIKNIFYSLFNFAGSGSGKVGGPADLSAPPVGKGMF